MDQVGTAILNLIDFVPDTLLHAVVYGQNDEKIGTVSHVHGMGAVSQVIVDIGGFLGIGTKSVLVPLKDLTFMRDADSTVHARTGLTKDQVGVLPLHAH